MSDLWRNLQLGWRLCLQPLSPHALIQYPPLRAGSVTGWWLLLLDGRIICYRVGRGKRGGEEGVTLSPWVWAVWCPGRVWLPVLWWNRLPGPVERKSFAASVYDLGLGIELGGGGLVLVAGWGWFLLPFLQEFLGLLFLLVLVLSLGLVGLRKWWIFFCALSSRNFWNFERLSSVFFKIVSCTWSSCGVGEAGWVFELMLDCVDFGY